MTAAQKTAAELLQMSEAVPVMGIRLRNIGPYTAVDAEIGGTWVEVIRERSDSNFCCVVGPNQMMESYYRPPPACGECHIKPGERCDLCGAVVPYAAT